MPVELTRRQVLWNQLQKLRTERASWDTEVRDIAKQMAPYRVVEDHTQQMERERGGQRKDDQIINSRPVRDLATCSAGLSSGMTSASRPWFGLAMSDKVIDKLPAVRSYLDQVRQIMLDVLAGSNFYEVVANDIYPDIGSIGTGCVVMDDHPKRGVHFTPCLWGTYWITRDAEGQVRQFFHRRFWKVYEIVDEFGEANCSELVRRCWRENRLNETFAVIRAIYPTKDRTPGALGRRAMAFTSSWWEETNPNQDQFLREEGYHEVAVFAPRWTKRGIDAYGRGPGWEVRGHCKALQHRETRLAQMVDLITKPPTKRKGDIDGVNLIPGGVTHVPLGAEADVEVLHLVDPQAVGVMKEEIHRNEQQISEGMYVNLWLAALRDAEEGGQRPTATEVQARKVEIMLMLGPLLQNSEGDFLDPMIARLYAILDRNNVLPYPPEELAGKSFVVEFQSILHTAQKAASAGGLRAFIEEILFAAQVDVQILDKVNVDALCDQFAKTYGVSPDVIRSSAEVQKLRAARAEHQQAAENGQAMAVAAKGARDLSGVDADNLRDVASTFGAGLPPIAEAQARGLPQ